jgi:hypothetical protein
MPFGSVARGSVSGECARRSASRRLAGGGSVSSGSVRGRSNVETCDQGSSKSGSGRDCVRGSRRRPGAGENAAVVRTKVSAAELLADGFRLPAGDAAEESPADALLGEDGRPLAHPVGGGEEYAQLRGKREESFRDCSGDRRNGHRGCLGTGRPGRLDGIPELRGDWKAMLGCGEIAPGSHAGGWDAHRPNYDDRDVPRCARADAE